MPTVYFIDSEENQFEADVSSGTSIMHAAVDNGLDGIIGECGGACSCATCHCYVEPEWWDKIDPPSEMEKEMLECAIEPRENSRLGCQIEVTDALDGITVRLPPSQY